MAQSHGLAWHRLGAEIWDALIADAKGQSTRIQWRHGLVKLLYHGEVKVTAGDIKRSLSSREFATKLDKYESSLQQAHGIAMNHRAVDPNPETTRMLEGHLEARLVQSFLEKKGKGEWELKKPCEVCHKFVQDFAAHAKQNIASPWEAEVQALKTKPGKAKKELSANPAAFLGTIVCFLFWHTTKNNKCEF